MTRDLSKPTQPSTAFSKRMASETEERESQASAAVALEDSAGAPQELRDRLSEQVEKLEGEIVDLSHDIHDHPETGFEEHHAASAVQDLLAEHGIYSELGVFGMDTALRAVLEPAEGPDDAPTLAILAEYDALPGLGHGCGHNVMAANSVGAFLALDALEQDEPGSVPARIVLQTTPAEEAATAKEMLAVRGAFEGIDAAIQTHSYGYDLAHQLWYAQRRFRVVFHGVSAHAASQPFMGRNALDAATLSLTGIGLLRQQILPADRVHAVIVDGGAAANVIPDRTELSLFVRSKYPETLKDLIGRVEDVFRGAALMTGTGVEFVYDEVANEMSVRDNGPLLTSWVRSQAARGRTVLPAGVVSELVAAGTDFGNVSQRIPGIHPLIAIGGHDLALHTQGVVEAAASPSGDAAAVDGAYGLAAVALDWAHDADFRKAVRDDFEATGGVLDIEHFYD